MKYWLNFTTKKMIAQLQKARAIELANDERSICSVDDFKDSLPVLCKRGLIDIKTVNRDSKEIICVYLTKSGISFLNQFENNKKGYRNIYNIY